MDARTCGLRAARVPAPPVGHGALAAEPRQGGAGPAFPRSCGALVNSNHLEEEGTATRHTAARTPARAKAGNG